MTFCHPVIPNRIVLNLFSYKTMQKNGIQKKHIFLWKLSSLTYSINSFFDLLIFSTTNRNHSVVILHIVNHNIFIFGIIVTLPIKPCFRVWCLRAKVNAEHMRVVWSYIYHWFEQIFFSRYLFLVLELCLPFL